MAKAFFNKEYGTVVQISTDSDVANLNINIPDYNEETISDSDFTSIRQSEKTISLVDGAVTITDLVDDEGNPETFDNREHLVSYLSGVIKPKLEGFLNNNPSNAMWNDVNLYKIEVDKVISGSDEAAVTYPIGTWEKYCADNSINYYHPLQIP